MATAPIYLSSVEGQQLRQSEVITGITEFIFDSGSGEVAALEHEFCVVVSQECDLERDFEARTAKEESPLGGVLLVPAISAADAREMIGGRDLWKPVIQNKSDRYHALEATPAEHDLAKGGLPALIVDFRRLFTIPSQELYRQIETGGAIRRRCRLVVPYREHLQNRLAMYLSRIALDRDHDVPMRPESLPAIASLKGATGDEETPQQPVAGDSIETPAA